MKTKTKRIMAVILVVCMAFSVSGDVFAYNLFPYSLNGGVGNWGYSNRYYWIDSSMASRSSMIDNAYSSWIHTSGILSTPISWKKTSVQKNGTVEFRAYNQADHNNGKTEMWRYDNEVDPYSSNWGWCKVFYNNYYNAGQGTIAHEIGHTMGLNENNENPYTVMCQAGSGRRVSTPQYDDLAGINAKYN